MITQVDVDEAIKAHVVRNGRVPSYVMLPREELRRLVEDMASLAPYPQTLKPGEPLTITLFGVPVFIKEEGVQL